MLTDEHERAMKVWLYSSGYEGNADVEQAVREFASVIAADRAGLVAEIERLRATLRKIAMPIELEGFSDWQRMNAAAEYIQFSIDLARAALKEPNHE